MRKPLLTRYSVISGNVLCFRFLPPTGTLSRICFSGSWFMLTGHFLLHHITPLLIQTSFLQCGFDVLTGSRSSSNTTSNMGYFELQRPIQPVPTKTRSDMITAASGWKPDRATDDRYVPRMHNPAIQILSTPYLRQSFSFRSDNAGRLCAQRVG